MITSAQMNSLSDLELMVYNYVLSHGDKVPALSVRELAQECHVSTTVVYNFCEKIGYNGYSAFKSHFKLQKTLEANKLGSSDNNSILYALVALETQEQKRIKLRQVVDLMAKADSLTFVGVGQSGVMAKYASIYFSNCGIDARYIGDSYFRIPIKSSSDLVVALSASGENTEIIHRVEKFKQLQVPVVSITNMEDCTIAKLANVGLTYEVPAQTLSEVKPTGEIPLSMTSQVPVMYLLETLAKAVLEKQSLGLLAPNPSKRVDA